MRIVKLIGCTTPAAHKDEYSYDSSDAVEQLNIKSSSSDKLTKLPYYPASATPGIIPLSTKAHRAPKGRKWTNWAGNQTCRPSRLLRPTTVQDIVDIVKCAKEERKTIRCVASAHTWSSSSVVEDGILVFVNKMTKIFPPAYTEGQGWTVELETGVTVRALDDYLRKHSPPLAMTANIVMDTACYGGMLALGSHGAATHSRTLSDLACEVKIVDSTGTLNTFTREKDPIEFSAAACNLGLLGVIYSYTLRVEPMFNLVMSDSYPLFMDLFDCPKQGGAWLKEMVLLNDQTQILYWPFNTHFKGKGEMKVGRYAKAEVWVKQWRRTDQPESVTSSWKLCRRVRQHIESSFGTSVLRIMAAKPKIAPAINSLIHQGLRRPGKKVLAVPDAIHFQGNLEAPIVVGLECVFKVDKGFERPCRAWRFAVDKVYEYAMCGKYPVNMTMDMRFIKSSDQIMSYVYDKDPEAIFCTVEILSAAKTKGFEDFSAMLAQHWMSEYKARVHWAKLWEHIPGIVPYLREQAGPQLDQFESIRQKYDPQGMFLNKTFAGVLGHK
ncbi:hypothetical protein BG015_004026 [Linnemannia schmuckeri]|uniref:D-arabinono-1,4-lactone oxidase n=1 Tax=Linnemannia schmuckeri TaxID=64567 RepID=A0A9P5S4M0_9FUNG|nr:hypothetical protein BG015_004026 [Linnemannia schmuckeri]